MEYKVDVDLSTVKVLEVTVSQYLCRTIVGAYFADNVDEPQAKK